MRRNDCTFIVVKVKKIALFHWVIAN
ncbi:hypothetical protein MED222_05435 [Vibrio sp. MED222]|nr:hypothetical protein MED222_05435 [Vibrio sp. MED222]